jgi:hypothetical protein
VAILAVVLTDHLQLPLAGLPESRTLRLTALLRSGVPVFGRIEEIREYERTPLEISVCIDGSATAYPGVSEAVEPILEVPHPSIPALKTLVIQEDAPEQAKAEVV